MLQRKSGGFYPVGGWYNIKEFSPVDGSAVDSTVAAVEDTATADVWGYPTIAKLPDGYVFSQHIQGTLHFGDLTINSSGNFDNMMLIKYTAPSPPTVSPENILSEAFLSRTNLYPNPAHNEITMQNSDNKSLGDLSIYDVSGKLIYHKFIGNSQATIDVKNFPAGFYFIRSGQLQATIKFIKQ